ncbi:hypothetical protein [Pontibacter mucosus]|uniref:hypothetical protein n=1 Tax=Pontibacter mucosus TaxID=1649266 RepID=UPI001B8771A9|nr:hypothetical protein [Pontibacter mucosus]
MKSHTLYLGYTFISAGLYFPLFRMSLSGTTSAADFHVRVGHTFILCPYFILS